MVKLFCAIVGDAGNAFPVDVDNSASVGDLKKVIKAENPATITCDAKDLRLFLAKKDGAWLTEADVKKGVEDTTGLKLLDAARPMLQRVGLSDQDVGGVDEEAEAEGRGPVNVLVEVPSNPILEKMKKQKKDGGSTSQNSFLDGLITDFFSLLWPLDEIHSTKKDV